MQKFNLSRKLFDFEKQDSDRSTDSVIFISSDSEKEVSDSWDSDWSIENVKMGPKYFDKKLCYALPRKIEKTKIELCKTLLPVPESHMSPAAHDRGPTQDVPQLQTMDMGFHASQRIRS